MTTHMTPLMTPLMTLGQAHAWIRARIPAAVLVGDPATPVMRVHTDSRSLEKGDLFVALKGERFDANEFLSQAKTSGADAALAHGGLAAAGLAGIEVPNSTLGLGALAAGWRQQFDLPLIAVTGSNGKTTVTQMIASILRAAHGEQALSTAGNFNNDIGVPLTLLRMRASHQIAVLELGMNHPGEIAYLADLVRPSVALVNNAQREHLEFMHTVEAVARENGSVMAALGPKGCAVFPAHDAYSALWADLAQGRPVCTFGSAGAQVSLLQADWVDTAWQVNAKTPQGDVIYRVHIAGRHNVSNSLAAVACALSAGVPLSAVLKGLSDFEPVKGRSRALSLKWGEQDLTLVDDTYNANPDSVRAAIDVLAELPGPHLLVLGDMGEVGDQGPAFHAEIGAYAHERQIEQVLCLGDLARHTVAACPGARHFADIDTLIGSAKQTLAQTRSALVKGSRFMKMERVVQAFLNTPQTTERASC